MAVVTALIFIATYVGVALGRVPRLTLDRTGIALLGAIGMVAAGALSFSEAVDAIDFPTIILLYALMIVSAQLRLGGFYTWSATAMMRLLDRPRLFLLLSMVLSAVLSALLANDIVCFAFTPVLARALLSAGLNPLPFLLGLAAASNIGSAATIIGNPQNMLIGQVGRLGFGAFFTWCAPPSAAALALAFFAIVWLYRGRWGVPESRRLSAAEPPAAAGAMPNLNLWQTGKGLIALTVLVVLFFTPIARERSAIAAAGVLLCSRRMKTKDILGLVDWHLITLFCALFIVIRAIAALGLPAAAVTALAARGVELTAPAVLTCVSVALSNLFSNVPAVMLLLQFLDPAQPGQWYLLAVSSTFAGNLIIIGSIANLIVIEQAAQFGIKISFREHARTGIPVTLLSLATLAAWLWVLG